MQAMATNLVGLGMTMSQFGMPGAIMNGAYPNIANGASYQQLLTQMAIPNPPVAQLVNNPSLTTGMNNSSVPGSMGAIVAAMASQQQQQQLQALTQSQATTSSIFSSPGSVAQQIPTNNFAVSQSASNSLANGALSALPTNLTGKECCLYFERKQCLTIYIEE